VYDVRAHPRSVFCATLSEEPEVELTLG
jgi:hypothetical protein